MTDRIWFTVISFHIVALLLLGSMLVVSRRPGLLFQLLAAVLGLVAGLIDVGSDDVQVTVLLLLVFGYFLGFATPQQSGWKIALLLGMWVPLFGMVHAAVVGGAASFGARGLGSFLSLIPAFGGVYLGAMIRRTADIRDQESPERRRGSHRESNLI